MTLSEYIRQVGVPAFSKKFRVKQRTVVSYMYGARRPRPKLAEKIVRETPVGWDGIYAKAAVN
jgi:hypothetical protein